MRGIIILIIAFFSCQQSQKKSEESRSLEVPIIKDIYVTADAFKIPFWNTVQCIKDDKIYKQSNDFFEGNPELILLFDSLPESNYQLLFISDFGDSVKQEKYIYENFKLELPSKLDSFYTMREMKSDFIQSLTNEKILKIHKSSMGCFHHITSFMEIDLINFRVRYKENNYIDEKWKEYKLKEGKKKLGKFLSDLLVYSKNGENCSYF